MLAEERVRVRQHDHALAAEQGRRPERVEVARRSRTARPRASRVRCDHVLHDLGTECPRPGGRRPASAGTPRRAGDDRDAHGLADVAGPFQELERLHAVTPRRHPASTAAITTTLTRTLIRKNAVGTFERSPGRDEPVLEQQEQPGDRDAQREHDAEPERARRERAGTEHERVADPRHQQRARDAERGRDAVQARLAVVRRRPGTRRGCRSRRSRRARRRAAARVPAVAGAERSGDREVGAERREAERGAEHEVRERRHALGVGVPEHRRASAAKRQHAAQGVQQERRRRRTRGRRLPRRPIISRGVTSPVTEARDARPRIGRVEPPVDEPVEHHRCRAGAHDREQREQRDAPDAIRGPAPASRAPSAKPATANGSANSVCENRISRRKVANRRAGAASTEAEEVIDHVGVASDAEPPEDEERPEEDARDGSHHEDPGLERLASRARRGGTTRRRRP